MATLIVSRGSAEPEEHRIHGRALLGRAEGNEIRVDDPAASREHALIYNQDGVYFIRDLESRNGTHVNGKAAFDRRLESGDEIAIGQVRMRFYYRPGDDWLDETIGPFLFTEVHVERESHAILAARQTDRGRRVCLLVSREKRPGALAQLEERIRQLSDLALPSLLRPAEARMLLDHPVLVFEQEAICSAAAEQPSRSPSAPQNAIDLTIEALNAVVTARTTPCGELSLAPDLLWLDRGGEALHILDPILFGIISQGAAAPPARQDAPRLLEAGRLLCLLLTGSPPAALAEQCRQALEAVIGPPLPGLTPVVQRLLGVTPEPFPSLGAATEVLKELRAISPGIKDGPIRPRDASPEDPDPSDSRRAVQRRRRKSRGPFTYLLLAAVIALLLWAVFLGAQQIGKQVYPYAKSLIEKIAALLSSGER